MYWSPGVTEMDVTEQEITIKSELLKRELTITLLMPENYKQSQPLNLLLLNDGQEAEIS
jgi:enterochelin esterase family protein